MADKNRDYVMAGLRDAHAMEAGTVWLADLGRRFEQRRNFIDDLERAVPAFYEKVGQKLKAWQPPPPKLKEDRAEPDDATPAAISEEAEAASME